MGSYKKTPPVHPPKYTTRPLLTYIGRAEATKASLTRLERTAQTWQDHAIKRSGVRMYTSQALHASSASCFALDLAPQRDHEPSQTILSACQ